MQVKMTVRFDRMPVMCELLGVVSRLPVAATIPLGLVASHGVAAPGFRDGWGVAFHRGDDQLLIKQPEPASDSAWVDFLGTWCMRVRSVVPHVRHATYAEISLRTRSLRT